MLDFQLFFINFLKVLSFIMCFHYVHASCFKFYHIALNMYNYNEREREKHMNSLIVWIMSCCDRFADTQNVQDVNVKVRTRLFAYSYNSIFDKLRHLFSDLDSWLYLLSLVPFLMWFFSCQTAPCIINNAIYMPILSSTLDTCIFHIFSKFSTCLDLINLILILKYTVPLW